jgi:hypothetical protein
MDCGEIGMKKDSLLRGEKSTETGHILTRRELLPLSRKWQEEID